MYVGVLLSPTVVYFSFFYARRYCYTIYDGRIIHKTRSVFVFMQVLGTSVSQKTSLNVIIFKLSTYRRTLYSRYLLSTVRRHLRICMAHDSCIHRSILLRRVSFCTLPTILCCLLVPRRTSFNNHSSEIEFMTTIELYAYT